MRTKQKGGKKTGQYYTVVKGWKPIDNHIWYILGAPERKGRMSRKQTFDKRNNILSLEISDRIELRSKKTKIDTYTCFEKKEGLKWESTWAEPKRIRGKDCLKLYDPMGSIHQYSKIEAVEWIKIKKNNSEIGWILESLLETHLKKERSRSRSKKKSRSKTKKSRSKTKKSRSKTKKSRSSKNKKSRSSKNKKSRSDVFYSAEEEPFNPTGALQPRYREGMKPFVPGGIDYSGAIQPSKKVSEWNWHPSMRPDLSLYGMNRK